VKIFPLFGHTLQAFTKKIVNLLHSDRFYTPFTMSEDMSEDTNEKEELSTEHSDYKPADTSDEAVRHTPY
jgi:hypothetical protein